ncbi:DNA-processing protein DprA [Luteimonas sp. SX5]|uniref:DNA-processing protein DprA n=1 Tax=Luteimonas galliterrae TaxID=2940486 RepID=A0ABT0MJA9_9GAMM|nr:DNA-processing protein DprA [Luteimonas galliterrae]MCL1634957.1 DNA-processing protein DprA [Luteimonas galliterrae]
MRAESQEALLKLHHAGGAVVPRRRLLDNHATPADALAAGKRAWREAELSEAQIHALERADNDALAASRAWLAQPGHHLLGWHDPDYPPQLRRIPSPPLALFVDGDPALLWHPSVAVVGSRVPTAGGRDTAYDFAHMLAASGFAVASGLAAGVDAAAHQGALAVESGLTIAVLGTGPDVPYPRENAGLMAQIAARGAVVSEHAPGTLARPSQFPSRNRILAGLALGTLVIEATLRSGALITAKLAGDYGREVFAVPGSIHNPMIRGCHQLIRDGACLVERADEVIAAVIPVAAELAATLRSRLETPISMPVETRETVVQPTRLDDPDYQNLWTALGHDPTGMDRLIERTGLTAAELSSMLLVMELEGHVSNHHGRYTRKTLSPNAPETGAGRGK